MAFAPISSAEHSTSDHEAVSDANVAAKSKSDFSFLPTDLTGKCRTLIESYHAMHGFAGLPDMLWTSEARDVIEGDRDLRLDFKRACKSRGARRANDSFVAIAVIVVSLEVLVRDFAGWGKRFPAAKSKAEALLGARPPGQRVQLMDLYLYPSLAVRRDFADVLASAVST
jgi:hypothetical protein